MTIILPLPAKELSPNVRVHRLKKAPITRHHRQAAFFATLTAIGAKNCPARILAKDRKWFGILHSKPLRNADYHRVSETFHPAATPQVSTYSLVFYFATIRERDTDNAETSCKAYRDGIADALRVNDSVLHLGETTRFFIDITNPRLEITLAP